MIALGLGYALTRLVQEANPEWRLVSWALSIEVIGFTLLLVPNLRLSHGRADFPAGFYLSAFPFLFFLTAVPWPTVLEQPVIQGLMTLITGGTVALLEVCGIPALQRGNLVETGSGWVGIDEACSGIRSFQAAIMIALFFGQVFRLSPLRRVGCVIGGMGLSLLFNLLRTTLLAMVVAKGGSPALARWHDPAGLCLLFSCFICIWLLALYLGRGGCRCGRVPQARGLSPGPVAPGAWVSVPAGLCWALIGWILLVEVGTEAWYGLHEDSRRAGWRWHPLPDRTWPGFRELGFTEAGRRLLRFDEGLNATWQLTNGWRWQLIFLRWSPGKVAAQLARNHTPDDCLPAAGHVLEAESGLYQVRVQGVKLPFRYYRARDENRLVYVFYCLWDDSATTQTFQAEWLTYSKRLKPVLAGRRNGGQRSLELALWGPSSSEEARQAFGELVPNIIRFER